MITQISVSEFDISTISGLTLDSRQVKSGYLFGAFVGARSDGRDYIADAVRHGAHVILAKTGTVLPELDLTHNVVLITDDNPRRAFAHMAAAFYGTQPEYNVAITGTNGKTSTAHFVKQIWTALGHNTVSVGTLGVRGRGVEMQGLSGSMTTPDPVTLHAELSDLAAVGVTHLVMEASSHGLDQYRLDGVRLKAAAFTNLSRDHLDYHGTMDVYQASKTRLFSEVLADDGVAVLNADAPEFDVLAQIARDRGIDVIDYGHAAQVITLCAVSPYSHGQHVSIKVFDQAIDFDLSLVGDFQVMNVLCALGLVLAGSDTRAWNDGLQKAVENLKGAPGRLQLVSGHPNDAAIYVDYAHTPDALDHVLRALRAHTTARLICVFGCGGDRDAGKRPQMGEIAARLADVVYVTDDNPRNEKAALIRSEIMRGAPDENHVMEIGDRAEAIATAVGDLQVGDILVIAGKGHEVGQVFADGTIEFDDVKVAEAAVHALRLNKKTSINKKDEGQEECVS